MEARGDDSDSPTALAPPQLNVCDEGLAVSAAHPPVRQTPRTRHRTSCHYYSRRKCMSRGQCNQTSAISLRSIGGPRFRSPVVPNIGENNLGREGQDTSSSCRSTAGPTAPPPPPEPLISPLFPGRQHPYLSDLTARLFLLTLRTPAAIHCGACLIALSPLAGQLYIARLGPCSTWQAPPNATIC